MAPIGSHNLRGTLQPGERVCFVFVLGYCENPEEEKFVAPNVINKAPAYKLMEQFSSEAQFDAAFDELAGYWDGLLSIYQVQSGEPASQPHGQPLEPVSMHGDVQHVPFGQLL